MLTREELHRLEKLSCISLSQGKSEGQEEKFLSQLDGIVSMLGQLKDIHLDGDVIDGTYVFPDQQVLSPLGNVSVYAQADVDDLFANAHHEKVGNSIVVKSAVESV